MQKERYQSQINQNFGTICHTEVCLTFSRLAAKLSEMITKFWGCNLKIQHRSSFDLNGLKNGSAKYFKNCIKLLHFFQGLIWRIYCWGASKLIQIFLPDMCELGALALGILDVSSNFWAKIHIFAFFSVFENLCV